MRAKKFVQKSNVSYITDAAKKNNTKFDLIDRVYNYRVLAKKCKNNSRVQRDDAMTTSTRWKTLFSLS